nr:MAG TPA: hypothetical protein [Bacteriophage sp.]
MSSIAQDKADSKVTTLSSTVPLSETIPENTPSMQTM